MFSSIRPPNASIAPLPFALELELEGDAAGEVEVELVMSCFKSVRTTVSTSALTIASNRAGVISPLLEMARCPKIHKGRCSEDVSIVAATVGALVGITVGATVVGIVVGAT